MCIRDSYSPGYDLDFYVYFLSVVVCSVCLERLITEVTYHVSSKPLVTNSTTWRQFHYRARAETKFVCWKIELDGRVPPVFQRLFADWPRKTRSGMLDWSRTADAVEGKHICCVTYDRLQRMSRKYSSSSNSILHRASCSNNS